MRGDILKQAPRFVLVLALSWGWAACGSDSTAPPPESGPTPFSFNLDGLPDAEAFLPASNPTTVEGVALGRRLFYDQRLSGDETQSCGSCHQQAFAFTDGGRRFSLGIDGIEGTTNAPAIINALYIPDLFWDGRSATLEEQALEPVPNPIEMHVEWDVAVARLQADEELVDDFESAFGTRTVTKELVVRAIAQFERTLVSNNSRFDKYVRGELELTPQELRGFDRYKFENEGDCFHCHALGGLFTHNVFANNGLDADPDPGRFANTGDEFDMGKFRAPTLRNIEVTGPYMHDGRFDTLEQVLDHYGGGMQDGPNFDSKLFLHLTQGRTFSTQAKADIIAFLKTLTDEEFLTNPDFADPNEK